MAYIHSFARSHISTSLPFFSSLLFTLLSSLPSLLFAPWVQSQRESPPAQSQSLLPRSRRRSPPSPSLHPPLDLHPRSKAPLPLHLCLHRLLPHLPLLMIISPPLHPAHPSPLPPQTTSPSPSNPTSPWPTLTRATPRARPHCPLVLPLQLPLQSPMNMRITITTMTMTTSTAITTERDTSTGPS